MICMNTPLANPEHPPLGKLIMGVFMQIIGDRPAGWRAASLASAILLIAFLPSLVDRARITRAGWLALLPPALLVLDPLVFVVARVAMLDALVMSAYAIAALLFIAALEHDRRSLRVAASAITGAALAIKWSAIPLVAPLFVGTMNWRPSDRTIHFDRKKALDLGLPMIAVYVAAFLIPGALEYKASSFPVAIGPIDPSEPWWSRFFLLQWKMISFHVGYFGVEWRSPWYAWLWARQPVWFYVKLDPDLLRVIAAVGSPVFWTAGLVAVSLCLVAGVLRRDRTPLVIALFPIAQLAFWAIAPRMTFIYYMATIVPFYALAIAWCLSKLSARASAIAAILLVASSAAWFAFVRPVATGAPLGPDEQDRYFRGTFSSILTHDSFPLERVREFARTGTFEPRRGDE
jgi:predicted membrane-bound dolichyl-phosphate-mannose-protein mannosyltransferase